MEEDTAVRPNIRIEIQNNLVEPMEVETCRVSDGEEGEISDGNEVELAAKDITCASRPLESKSNKRVWPATDGSFMSSINAFDSSEQDKLFERAKRFDLQPSEINNFTERDLQLLHDSLGITVDKEKCVHFEAVHMHGTDGMTTEDVLEYFKKYGPFGIEWITDESCNVVWTDRIKASRALYFLSKPIRGMPVEDSSNPFLKAMDRGDDDKSDKGEEGQSILLKNKHREVEISMEEDTDKENGAGVHISEIAFPIPPGYWRLGIPHRKAKNILLRFTLKSDKKPFRAEKFSEQYKKHANPNYGGLKGITSESRKLKHKGIFGRNRDIEENGAKNPWGNLARNWHEDARYAEPDYKEPPEPVVKPVSSPMLHRLGYKRGLDPEIEEIIIEKEPDKKSKVPRMRMYADEEEEKIKRRRQLNVLKSGLIKLESKSEDLRNVLRLPSRNKPEIKETVKIHDVDDKVIDTTDLGSKLKNRKLNIRRDIIVAKRQDIRSRLEQRNSLRLKSDDRPRVQIRDISPHADNRLENVITKPKRHSPHRKEYKKHHTTKKDSDSEFDDSYDEHKTGSKVTVVIKKQKTPAVASTIWSRIHSERERLKTVSEGKLRVRSESRSNSSNSSSDSSSSSSGSDSESSPAESPAVPKKRGVLERPGFRNSLRSRLDFTATEHKSPLRIEISNDHFRKD